MYNELITQLRRHEGMELKPYKDTVGKMTIGIGRNLDDVGISETEALYLLQNDIDKRKFKLMGYLPYWHKLNEARQEVLINMCFMGFARLKGFKKMFKALEDENYEEASKEMLDSKWATQVKGRADELARQMLEGKRTTDL